MSIKQITSETNNNNNNNNNNNEQIRKLLHKLVEYELSGLSPDEVMSFTSMGKGKIVAKLKQVTAERDALLVDYEEVTSRVVKCPICKNYKGIPLLCGNVGTASCKDYAWRGFETKGVKHEIKNTCSEM